MSNTEVVSVLEWPELLGGGAVGTILLFALVEWLRRTFATRSDVDGVGSRINALQTLYIQAREAADEAHQLAARVQAEQEHHWELLTEHVTRPLERMTEKLEIVSTTQAAQAATLDQVCRRLDRAESPRACDAHPHRREP